MAGTFPFRTRARTIDHLGRQQIADCPTAISELWKNAYDAYATSVALHIFDGAPPVAAIVDDGHGMNKEEFIERWLVVGTESKLSTDETPEEDRGDLPIRSRQGEKGIGRLSVAYLGPQVIVLSKRRKEPMVAALIDWRLFQNPYLLLEDLEIPVEELDDPADLLDALPLMRDALQTNIRPSKDSAKSNPSRAKRIVEAWQKYSAVEAANKDSRSTADAILTTTAMTNLTQQHLAEWCVWSSKKEERRDHGTALFTFDIPHELSVWGGIHDEAEDEETIMVKDKLRQTLTAFVDPYSADRLQFEYRVVSHKRQAQKIEVSGEDQFDLDDLRLMEHVVDGTVDERGIFSGNVRAFGRDLGKVILTPQRIPTLKSNEKVGVFDFCIGTSEFDFRNTSLTQEQHAQFLKNAEKYSGLAVYRDKLRVMPYGRATDDFFGMEERRSMNAGREFWSHRRSFGRVGLHRDRNPNLRDKAGREGLIDNRARRELQILVVNILQQTARRYFGSDSEVREQILPENNTRNAAILESEAKAKRRRTTVFRQALTEKAEPLVRALEETRALQKEIVAITASKDSQRLPLLSERVEQIRRKKTELALPPKPIRLGALEERYREYRDKYNAFVAAMENVSNEWSRALDQFDPLDPEATARSAFSRHQKYLNDAIRRWEDHLVSLLEEQWTMIEAEANEDRKRYYEPGSALVEELVTRRMRLTPVLNALDGLRETFHEEFAAKYESRLRAYEQLGEKIDLDAALVWNSEQRAELEKKVDQLNALAQLGITVEIVGHELEALDAEVNRNLKRLPLQTRQLEAYQLAASAHEALVARLRFLSPLQFSGPRLRTTITGAAIAKYVGEFFERQFVASRIKFVATNAFKAISFKEYPSRVYPVFINLVNNSLYWLTFGQDREIRLDVVDDAVVVSDSGPGVDPDDMLHLFELFFTRRTNGRGVGLYLCKVNLGAGGHTIEYATTKKFQLLQPGANFVIRLKRG